MNRRGLVLGGGVLAVGGALAAASFLRMGSLDNYGAAMSSLRAPLPATPDIRELIRFATLAANGHNTQPWRFRIEPGRVSILPDLSRRTPVVDPDDHHLFASLGCAAANLELAAAARGMPGDVTFKAEDGGHVQFAYTPGPARGSALFDAIPARQATRSDYDGRAVPTGDLGLLAQAATVVGVDVVLVTERARLDTLRDLILAGNTRQMNDPAFVRELKTWIRFNPVSAQATGDGLFAAASGNPVLPDWIAATLFGLVFKAGPENDKYARQMATSAGAAIFVAQRDDRDHWVRVGRACQRFALQATALGIRTAFVNQPTEVADLRPQVAALAGLPGRRPNLILRFGYAPTLPYAPRRRPSELIVTGA
jgi:nitroreductase